MCRGRVLAFVITLLSTGALSTSAGAGDDVCVGVTSDRPVTLRRIVNWRRGHRHMVPDETTDICTSPCEAKVKIWWTYDVVGDGVLPARIQLPRDQSSMRLTVSTASQSNQQTGNILLIAGFPLLVGGGDSLLLTAGRMFGRASPTALGVETSIFLTGIAAVAVGAALSSRTTTVKDSTGRRLTTGRWAVLSPTGLRF